MNNSNKRMFYLFVGCMVLSIIIIGATFAYFAASSQDGNTVRGRSETTSFSMSISRVTMADIINGLVPMKNSEAPHASEQLCLDDNNNAGCQIYKITVSGGEDDVFFVDGYITFETKDGVEARFTRVYPKKVSEDKEIFITKYTTDDFKDDSFDERAVIKTGSRNGNEGGFNHKDDYDCLFVSNEQIGGADKNGLEVATSRDFYVMIWIYDDGTSQDYMQGMEHVFNGEATFVTAEGNEIKATFD